MKRFCEIGEISGDACPAAGAINVWFVPEYLRAQACGSARGLEQHLHVCVVCAHWLSGPDWADERADGFLRVGARDTVTVSLNCGKDQEAFAHWLEERGYIVDNSHWDCIGYIPAGTVGEEKQKELWEEFCNE